MARTLLRTAALAMLMTLAASVPAWAHTTVSPGKAPAGTTETFTVSTPGEKGVPIVEERVEVPQEFEVSGVSSPEGWRGSAEGGSIVWSGGEIEQGEEQEFTFEARVPAQTGEYKWRAFDTYEDGSVSEWTGPEDSDSPASVVRVVSEGSSPGESSGHEHGAAHGSHDDLPETGGVSPLAYAGAVFALIALGSVLLFRLRRS